MQRFGYLLLANATTASDQAAIDAVADMLRDLHLAVGVGMDDNGNAFVNALGDQAVLREAARNIRSTYPTIDARTYKTSIYVPKGHQVRRGIDVPERTAN